MQLNCIIVDDEPPAIRVLENHITRTPALHCLATFTNTIEALHFLQRSTVDVILLDIQMPHLSGLQLARLTEGPTRIIFTTAYPEYALQGFEYNAADYLLKPISFERFCQAIGKLQMPQTSPPAPRYLFVKTDGKNKYIKVDLAALQYIEGLSNYVILHCGDQKITTYSTLKNLEAQLPSGDFIRVHKSYIVAFAHIRATDNHRIQLPKQEIPIGEVYREAFFKAIGGMFY
jgi:two-component system, LytTR family, response regulator